MSFCTQSRGKGNRTMYGSIQIGGFEKGTAFVLRKRWRPKAAHARFSSSKKLEGVDTWIFEMDAAPGTLGFYSPMTTPFGYYGSSWLADGRVNKSINFSLWSFGRGKKEPPIEQLSHLLAIGNPDAKFGGFDHEGTGVKIRGWNPFEIKPGQTQVFAARISRGEVYDTFYSYFFDSKELRWRLYGVGRKVKAKRPRPFFPGSFVEVPGRAEKQRTGAYVRRMRYRGWVLDGERRAHRIDQMSFADIDKDTGLTYTDRGLTEDGRFFLETGGWSFRKVNRTNKDVVKLPVSSIKSHPVCIIPVKLREILRTPSAIECTKLRREGQKVVVEFNVRNLSVMKDAVVYWGDQEALTFMSRWQNSRKISKIKEGANTVKIPWSDSKKPIYLRLFLKNDEGQFWSTDTAILKP